MKRIAGFAAALLLAVAACRAELPRPLENVNVLPLALDDHFQFRKTELFLNDPIYLKPTTDPMLQLARERLNFGAVTNVDRMQRRGHYFTFFWRALQPAEVTVRLEYRQQNLGAFVQAREWSYENARGSMKTQFQVIGDDYLEDGRITAWRALLISHGKIVGLTQSYLWN